MFRLPFGYLVAASTFLVVSCSKEIFCPNDKCSESENLELYSSYISRYGQYINRRLGCCKLTGLENYNITYGEEEDLRRLAVLIIEKCKIGNDLSNLVSELQPTVLRIIDSGLKALKINDFTGGNYLTELNVSRNGIDRLEPNIFIYAPNIEVIDLSHNLIAEVSEYSFDNIPKLRILILSNNLIKRFGFNSVLSNLEVFMIDNNSLTTLKENIFAKSYKLKELCLNNNKLNVSELSVAGSDLDVFDMSNNPTSVALNAKNLRIKNSNVKHLTIHSNAVSIDASNNQIESIVLDPQNNSLVELNLSGNNFTKIQNLTVLTSIERLDLSFNRIEDFNLTSFYNMSRLMELNLEHSGLKHIDFGLFSQQRHLNWLDISYNNLGEVNFDMLTSSIERLFVEGNELTNIDLTDIRITLPHLQVLGLSNNKFSCEKLIEIRKQLAASSIQMYVDEMLMVKFSRNINGIGCVNENSSATETMEINSGKLLPIHTNTSEHIHFIDKIQRKINEIEQSIRRHNDSLTEKSIHSKDDIISMRQELMNIRNDGDLKIINAKADILMSVSRLFNVTTNGSDVNVDLKSTVEEVNRINLERYQSLSSQLKLVRDKLGDLAQSVTNLQESEMYDGGNVLHLKQKSGIIDEHNNNSIQREDGSVDLISLKNMMSFIIGMIICLIVGFSLILFYKRCYQRKRRYNSTNTVNTNVEQSLV